MWTIFNIEEATAPLFSIAISRDESETGAGGVFVIGGLPDTNAPTVNASSEWAVAPFELLATSEAQTYSEYAITVETVTYFSAASPSPLSFSGTQFIVDSGTTRNCLPADDADAFNSLFNPPAQFDEQQQTYYVDCSAVAPSLVYSIGGQAFSVHPFDLILSTGAGTCFSGVSRCGASFILGDVFLRNVLAVFDWGNSEMR